MYIYNRMGSIQLPGGDPSWKQYTFNLPKGLPQQGGSNVFPKIFVVNKTDSQSESEASPVKRPRLLDDSNDRPEETSRSKQKSRRRCFQCQTKLELVQQELGSCRCGEYCLSVTSGFLPQRCSDPCHRWKYGEHLHVVAFRHTLNRSYVFHWWQKVIISSCLSNFPFKTMPPIYCLVWRDP